MKKWLNYYLTAYRGLAVRNKSWLRHVVDPFIVIGIPLAIFFFVLSLFAAAGVPCLLSDGEPVVGISAFITGLALSFLAIPLMFVFVGSIAWLMMIRSE